MKRLLAIDTSTDLASVTLWNEGVFITRTQPGFKSHAAHILPMVDEILKQGETAISDLDGIVFGQGPGSFTGLRITVSVIKGLAFAHQIPVFPVTSFEAIFQSARDKGINGHLLGLLDARMSELYWQYEGDTTPQVSAPEDILPAKNIKIVGLGFEPYLARLPKALQQEVLETHALYPSTEAMITRVLTQQIQPITSDKAEPLYIRNKVTD